MKLKFLTLTLLVLILNCNAAEEKPSVQKQELYSKIAELSQLIARTKHNIKVSENAIKKSNGWANPVSSDRNTYIQQRILEVQKEIVEEKNFLEKNINERRELLKKLDQNCEE